MPSYSQCGEDIWVQANCPPVKTFCEVGAFDGVQSSNTLLFENLGATGVLVEADPYLAAKCLDNRKAQTWCCACGQPWYGEFFINHHDRGLSGMKAEGVSIMVPVFPLYLILMASRIKELDLLSIDTEGTELVVWNTIGAFCPKTVIVEYQTCEQPPKDKEIVTRLSMDGYREVHKTKYNLILRKN